MATSERVREELGKRLLGAQQEWPGFSIDVREMRVPEVSPRLLVALDVRARGESWRVSLDYQGQEASLVSGDLTDETAEYLALLVRTHLFEWWHTKDTEKASRRKGTRLPQ
ncbi:hypothetical protein GCM10018785_47440 [Streptomyces longispororuber]|uniref:Uncharacterized protein n=1 Tax=Streptomyces longispororuber TaxID=68230 RepID=A0A919DSW0_9ACTN|nr:hypothetical protein [Streptomyces longispororuber]GHE73854.1 hypothetical protein GCM10018785_47440 [Streptomyces longispororuber]